MYSNSRLLVFHWFFNIFQNFQLFPKSLGNPGSAPRNSQKLSLAPNQSSICLVWYISPPGQTTVRIFRWEHFSDWQLPNFSVNFFHDFPCSVITLRALRECRALRVTFSLSMINHALAQDRITLRARKALLAARGRPSTMVTARMACRVVAACAIAACAS